MRRSLAHPDHRSHRSGLRALGAVLALAGAILFGIGMVSFFGAMGGGGTPSMFWCAFVGGPMLAIGLGMLKAGYLGTITRYVATETAPVVADTLSHVAHGTKDAVQATAAAVAKGLRGDAPSLRCGACGADAGPGARYCQQCGKPLATDVPCPQCSHTNAPSARFCAGCGHRVAAL